MKDELNAASVPRQRLELSSFVSVEREWVRYMQTIERLNELPLSERREELEELVVSEFKTTLMMADDEDLPFDTNYFELGFTSLRITEIKERLETQLGRKISTNVLFNSPTMERLLAYLTEELLADLFGAQMDGTM